MLSDSELKTLLGLIDGLVNATEGTWQSRRQSLLDLCDEDAVCSLAEFSAWFAYDDLDQLDTPAEEAPK